MYVEIPAVAGTAESRLAALKESRELLKQEPGTSKAVFGMETETPGKVAGSTELINLATYIETGHAYADLHPTGKRRPLVKNIQVTLVHPAGSAPTDEDLEHLLHHVKNGDFGEFIEDLITNGPQPGGWTMADEAKARAAATEANFTRGLWADKPEADAEEPAEGGPDA